MTSTLLKVLERGVLVWVVIMAVEALHATLRVFILVPLAGDMPARQISVITGSLIILGITFVFVRWLKGSSVKDYILVGGAWVVLTVAFEIVIGRCVMDVTWERIASDYNLIHGGLMPLGLLVLLLAPLMMAKLTDEI